MCKSLPGGTRFEGTKGSWGAAKAQYYERPVDATEEAAALAVVESPRLKGYGEMLTHGATLQGKNT